MFALALILALAGTDTPRPADAPPGASSPEAASDDGFVADEPSPRAWLDAEYERLQRDLADLDARAKEASDRLVALSKMPFGEEWQRVSREVHASLPGVLALDLVLRHRLSERPTVAEIRANVKKTLESMNSDVQCYSAPDAAKAVCKRVIADCAEAGLSASGGEVLAKELSDDFSETHHPATDQVDLPDTVSPPYRAAWGKRAQVLLTRCTLLAAAGVEFSATGFSRTPTEAPRWVSRFVPIYDLATLREHCALSEDERAASMRLLMLSGATSTKWPVKNWKEEWLARREACAKQAQDSCSAVYFIKGTPALAYPTKGCEVRRVTAEDVKEDLKRFELAGMTRADRLEHEELVDVIEACDAVAKTVGWRFLEPNVSPDCAKPESEAKPKRRRK